jgi:hypothetical protein
VSSLIAERTITNGHRSAPVPEEGFRHKRHVTRSIVLLSTLTGLSGGASAVTGLVWRGSGVPRGGRPSIRDE